MVGKKPTTKKESKTKNRIIEKYGSGLAPYKKYIHKKFQPRNLHCHRQVITNNNDIYTIDRPYLAGEKQQQQQQQAKKGKNHISSNTRTHLSKNLLQKMHWKKVTEHITCIEGQKAPVCPNCQ